MERDKRMSTHARVQYFSIVRMKPIAVMKILVKLWVREGLKHRGSEGHAMCFLKGEISSSFLPQVGSYVCLDPDFQDWEIPVTGNGFVLDKGVLKPEMSLEDCREDFTLLDIGRRPNCLKELCLQWRKDLIPYLEKQGFFVCQEPEIDPTPLSQLSD